MEIVSYRPEHLSELLDFLREQFPDSPQKGNRQFFEWRFSENPLGSSLDACRLAIENGRIVGQLGAIRDRLWAMNRWWDCCWLVDLILAKEHRGPGSAAVLRLFQEAIEKGSLLLITGAGPKFVRFYQTLGWSYREIAGTYFSIRRPAAALAMARDAGETHPALKPLLPFAGLAMTSLQALRGGWRHRSRDDFEYGVLQAFGPEIDQLIDRVLPSLPVTSHRSAAYLEWKFNRRPEGTHVAIAARRRGQAALSGYIAVKIMERVPRARWAEIVDFLAAPEDSQVFEGLLDRAQRTAAAADVDFLRLRCSRPEHRQRLRAPFWIRHDRSVIDGTFFRTENRALSDYLTRQPWHLTSLVSDRTDHGRDETKVLRRITDDQSGIYDHVRGNSPGGAGNADRSRTSDRARELGFDERRGVPRAS